MIGSLLPPIPADIIRGHAGGVGGMTVNADGTLFATVHGNDHCVYIHSVADRTADAVVVGTVDCAHREFDHPTSACFVHRDGVDTLLICDFGNNRVVEVTARGEFMRAIAVDGHPCDIAERDGVIAVSLLLDHAVVLLQYESGAVKPEVTIGSRTGGNADGQLFYPRGVAFTTDGRYILVADHGNSRVSKFSADSGAFVAHVISNGITLPTDVLQREDGSIVVVHEDGVMHVGEDGATVQNIIISGIPWSLSHSPPSNDVLVMCRGGDKMFVLRDAWFHSLRCAWVHACVM
jgi:sugar lactone lactonase YvrE